MPDMVRGSVEIKGRASYAWCSRTLTVVLREECGLSGAVDPSTKQARCTGAAPKNPG